MGAKFAGLAMAVGDASRIVRVRRCARHAAADAAAQRCKADQLSPTKPAASLNDELLKGLGPDPLAEPARGRSRAQRRTKPAAAKPDAAKPEQKPAATKSTPSAKRIGDPLDDELLKGLDDGESTPAEGEDSDPFVRLNRQMRKVESLIAQSKLDPATQQLQQKIVHDLEELIKKMQQQKSSSSSSSESSSKQQTASRDKVKQPGAEKGKNGARTATSRRRTVRSNCGNVKHNRPLWTRCRTCWARACGASFPRRPATRCCSRPSTSFCPSTSC